MDQLLGRAIQSLTNGVSQQPPHIRLPAQGEEQFNCLSQVVSGVSRRPPAEFVATLLSTALPAGGYFAHLYDRDGTSQYIVLFYDGHVRVFTFAGVECTVTDNSDGTYLDFDSATYDAKQVFRAITVADTTFVVNVQKTVLKSGSTSSARPTDFILWMKPNTSGLAQKMTLDFSSGDIVTWDITANTETAAKAIDNFETAFNAVFSGGEWTLTRLSGAGTSESSLIYGVLTGMGTEPDYINYTDSNDGNQAKFFYKKAQRFSDLPPHGYDGFTLEIVGEGGDIEDDYWVKYDEAEHAWVETVKPELDNAFNAHTMPHKLTRTGATTFTFDETTWDEREKGDEISSPDPSFVNHQIRNVVFHKDRLCLLADENVAASEAQEYFNHWITTATTTVDSDPLDLAGTGNRVAFLDWAVPYNQQLTLFSARGGIVQELRGVDGVLTPKNATIVDRAAYANSPLVGPLAVGRSIFFVQDRDTASGVYEYQSTELEIRSDEITAHVPSYIPGRIRLFKGSDNEQTLVLIPEVDQSAMYVYRFHYAGNDKVMSSWSKWRLSEATNILGMEFIGNKLYLLCYRADPKVFLQVIDFRKLADSDMGFRLHLDSLRESTGSYSALTDLTTWTLPFVVDSDECWVAVLGDDGWESQRGRSLVLTTNPGSATVTALGDFSAHPAMLGHTFLSKYTFSPAVVEQAQNISNAAISKLMLRQWWVAFQQTGYFKLRITRRDEDALDALDTSRADYVTEYTGRELGGFTAALGPPQLRDGVFGAGANGDARDVRVSVESEAYLPFTIASAEWEGYYSQRSRQA